MAIIIHVLGPWGFNMCYNPWAGWSMGFGYSFGWFHLGFGLGRPYGYWGGGWWGLLSIAHICIEQTRAYGYYGNNFGRNGNVYARNYSNNIYRFRNDVVTRDNRTNNIGRPNNFNRPNNTTSSGRAPNNNNARPGFSNRPNQQNNVYSDRSEMFIGAAHRITSGSKDSKISGGLCLKQITILKCKI